MVRWFRNTMRGSGLEFGCEILSDQPGGGRRRRGGRRRKPSAAGRRLPAEPAKQGVEATLPQVIVAPACSASSRHRTCTRGRDTGFAVLTKLSSRAPGFEVYDFAPVS